MSPTIHFQDGDEVEYKSVTVKVSGWVKCRYENGEEEDTDHFPPGEIRVIYGDVNYQSPHGQI